MKWDMDEEMLHNKKCNIKIKRRTDAEKTVLRRWNIPWILLTGLFLGFLKCSSLSFDTLGAIPLNSLPFWGKCVLYGIGFMVPVTFVFWIAPVIDKWLRRMDGVILSRLSDKMNVSGLRIFFFLAFMIAWIPVFLAMYPGYLAYDGPVQLLQIWPKLQLDASHPVVHTLFMSGCISLGKALLGSNEAGLMLYSIAQELILAYVLAYLLAYLLQKKVPKLIVIFDFLILSFHPLIQLFVVVTTKDVIFGALFVLFFLYSVDMVQDMAAFFGSRKKIVVYMVLAVLMALFRKQGIYCVCLMAPFMISVCRKYLKKACICLLVPVVLVLVLTGPVSDACGIIPDEPKEMLSVPIEQLTYVALQDENKISRSDLDTIASYIPSDVWGEYNPYIADPVKSFFNNELYRDNSRDFFRVWWKLGKEHPIQYVSAFGYLTEPYWYMGTQHHYWSLFAPFYSLEGSFVVGQKSLLPGYYGYLMRVGQNNLTNGGFWSILSGMFISISVPVYFLFFCLIGIIRQKKWEFLVPMILLGGYIGSLFLGPVACMRYIFPVLLFNPLCFGMLFMEIKQHE